MAEEILMYVGGEPKDDSKENSRDEYNQKWDKYISGEATLEEVSDHYTKGDIETLRHCKLGNILGFSKNSNKIKILTIHVGYSKTDLESKAFQRYMKRTKTEIENFYGKNNIELGFYIPNEEKLMISTYGFERCISADAQELAVLKRRLQKAHGVIDILDVRINPKVLSQNDYGTADPENINYLTPGPVKNDKDEYHLLNKFVVEHELMHCISYVTLEHNPTYFDDGYVRNISDYTARNIMSGNNLEFIPAAQDGKPIKAGNKTMEKVLETAQPKDENIFMVERNGTKHKLLVINPDGNFMRYFYNNKQRTKAIKNGTYISPAQRIAIAEAIKDYLVGEKRIKADKIIEKPNMVINNVIPKKNHFNIASQVGKGSRV